MILEHAWAERANSWLAAPPPEGTCIIQQGGELHLRRLVKVLDPARPLREQEDVAVAALDEVCHLVTLADEISRVGTQ